MNSTLMETIMARINTNIEASKEVNALANQLIKEFNVQAGFGLAGFLQVDSHFDNFAAVRAWVNKHYIKLDTGHEGENLLLLKGKLHDCLPEVA